MATQRRSHWRETAPSAYSSGVLTPKIGLAACCLRCPLSLGLVYKTVCILPTLCPLGQHDDGCRLQCWYDSSSSSNRYVVSLRPSATQRAGFMRNRRRAVLLLPLLLSLLLLLSAFLFLLLLRPPPLLKRIEDLNSWRERCNGETLRRWVLFRSPATPFVVLIMAAFFFCW